MQGGRRHYHFDWPTGEREPRHLTILELQKALGGEYEGRDEGRIKDSFI